MIDSYLKTKLYLKGFELNDLMHKKSFNLSDKARSHLDRVKSVGYSIEENFISSEECDQFVAIINDLANQYKDKIWVDQYNSDHRIHGSNFLSEKIDSFPTHQLVQETVKGFYQAEIVNISTLAAKMEFKEGNPGSGGGWHRDSPLKRQIKTILYLTDVEIENGPFQYIANSHIESNIVALQKKFSYPYDKMRFTDEELSESSEHLGFRTETFTAKKGTLLFADTRGVHRGMPILQGNRYAMTNYFYASHQVNDNLIKKFDKLLVKP